MTVRDYAKHINKSIPLIYKQIRQKKLDVDTRYGVILIKVK